jgi:hypothetical protein
MPNKNSRIIVHDTVQGVSQFKVEIAINTGSGYGGYLELTEIDPITGHSYSDIANEIYFTVTPLIQGSDETERPVWSFNFGYTIADSFNIGDKFKLRFSPAGWDEGNGNYFESAEYTITDVTNKNILITLNSIRRRRK